MLKLSIMKKWYISFNAKKTDMQKITSKRNIQSPYLTFGGKPILQVTTHKHLGLTLSNFLRFHAPVNKLVQKVNRAMSPLHPIAEDLFRKYLAQLYKTYILLYFDYCDVVYDDHLTFHDSRRLEILQNRTTRIVGK